MTGQNKGTANLEAPVFSAPMLLALNLFYLLFWDLWILRDRSTTVAFDLVLQKGIFFAALFAAPLLALRPWSGKGERRILNQWRLTLAWPLLAFVYHGGVYLLLHPVASPDDPVSWMAWAVFGAGAAGFALMVLAAGRISRLGQTTLAATPAFSFLPSLFWVALHRGPTGPELWLDMFVLLPLAIIFFFLVRLDKPRPAMAAPLVLLAALLWRGFSFPVDNFSPVEAYRDEGAESPDVILISIDTLRADALGAYGHPGGLTPNIDSLGRDGVVFSRTYAPAPWTLPSMATLLTGLYPPTHAAVRMGLCENGNGDALARLSPRATRISQILKTVGYRTAGFVRNPLLTREFYFDVGFDLHYSLGLDPMYRHPALVHIHAPRHAWALLKLLVREARGLPAPDIGENHVAWIYFNRHQPVFLWTHFLDPHLPYRKHDGQGNFYDGFPPEDLVFDRMRKSEYEPRLAGLTDREKSSIRRLYEGEVRFTDQRVGRVIEALKLSGRYDDALIVLTADHGEEFWEHGGFEHGQSHYDELLRVPLIIKLPGNRGAGSRVDHAAGLADVVPTALELINVDYPGPLEGRSLAPCVLAGSCEEGVYFSTNRFYNSVTEHAVIENGWKLIMDRERGVRELYNLDEDPAESVNLADREPGRAERLAGLLDRWLSESARLNALIIGPHHAGAAEMTARQEAELKALGYLQ